MDLIAAGTKAPDVPGVELTGRPTALFFYKVTCPVCQMAAPMAHGFERAYPGHIVGIGQDPEDRLASFAGEFDLGFRSVVDEPPYPVSDAYGISVVPTLVLVDGEGTVVEAVESWNRDGYNALSDQLAGLLGASAALVFSPGDGLPPFRPG